MGLRNNHTGSDTVFLRAAFPYQGMKESRMAAPPRDRARQNRLLRALTPPTLTQILPTLEPARLDMKEILAVPNVPIRFVYFPLTGLVSLISTMADGMIVEVITIGREGMVGLP